jgi:hypothetical protein
MILMGERGEKPGNGKQFWNKLIPAKWFARGGSWNAMR